MEIRPARILLVEDNPGDVILTRKSFERWNLVNDLDVVTTGEAAIERIEQTRPDIVLLDLNLPGISGFDVLRLARANSAVSHIPIVVLTSSSAEADIAKSYGYAANGYLVKPPTMKQLNNLVDVVVGHWFAHGRTP